MSKFLALIIVMSPVLSNYVAFGPISIGDIFCVMAIVPLLIHFKINALNVGAGVSSIVILIIGLFVLYVDGVNFGFLRMAFYYVLFFFAVSLSKLDFRAFHLVYINCSLFFSISIIVQWLIYQFLNVSVPLQLPIPHYELDTLLAIDHVFRSGGWFKEPSYFAIFLAPAFFYLLNSRAYIKYSLVVIAGVVSTSSLAVFLILASIAYFFLKAREKRVSTLFLALVFVIFLCSAVIFGGEWILISRVVEVFVTGGTLNERLLPMFEILQLSKSILVNPVAHKLLMNSGDSGLVWYSSAAYMLASLGWLGYLFISVNFLRLGVLGGSLLFTLSLTSHIFSNAYSFFVTFALLGLSKELGRRKSEYTRDPIATN